MTKLLSFIYYLDDTLLKVYVGRLNKDVKLKRESHLLIYMDIDQDFFDMQKFAGEVNFGHIMEHIKMHQSEI